MKRILISITLICSSFVFAEFLDEINKIDNEIQNKNYEKAYRMSVNMLSNSNLSTTEKATVEALIQDIENKMKIVSIDETLSAITNGTITLPSETVSSSTKFEKYKEYEKQVLSTNNEDAIHSLALLYVKDGLYERAMHLALKDKKGSIKNIYLAATCARMIGKYDTSINLYSKVLNVDGQHAKSILGLAMAYKGKGDFNKALHYMQKYSHYDSSAEVINAINSLQSR